MMNNPNCPEETQTVTKPKQPYHFMTKEELLEKEERIRQASIEAYKEQCMENREKLKDAKSKNSNEWKRINSGILDLDPQFWD